ncbi:MAG: selenocysteine-specific translation elongation factor, partial [Novosphingobium sp.]
MNRLVVGVIGHVDHGKTALVRALTGIDTDRLAEEKRRGVSIELGFAHFAAAGGAAIDLIDMPGHERFIRTMVAGAAGIDTVLVVVAADEGVRPQTREHVEIARLLGVRRAVLAISKADLAGAERIGEVSAAASDLLSRNGLAAVAPVLTSAAAGRGIAELGHALAALAAANPPPSGDGLPFFPIDRVFAVAGHGVVATGTLRGAAVGPGDTLELLPGPRKVRVRTVQVHGAAVAHALPGQRVALNLRDVAVGELARGMALAGDGSLSPQLWLTLAIAAAAGAPPLRNGLRLRALLGTGEVEARLRLL